MVYICIYINGYLETQSRDVIYAVASRALRRQNIHTLTCIHMRQEVDFWW